MNHRIALVVLTGVAGLGGVSGPVSTSSCKYGYTLSYVRSVPPAVAAAAAAVAGPNQVKVTVEPLFASFAATTFTTSTTLATNATSSSSPLLVPPHPRRLQAEGRFEVVCMRRPTTLSTLSLSRFNWNTVTNTTLTQFQSLVENAVSVSRSDMVDLWGLLGSMLAASSIAVLATSKKHSQTKKAKKQLLQLPLPFGLEPHAILGEGSFGKVLLVSKQAQAQPNGTRRSYALKVQAKKDEDTVEDIVHEMSIMQRLSHPFLVHLEKAWQDRNFFYFLLPLLQGGELTSRLLLDDSCHGNRRGGLPESSAKFYALCVADALAYMHGQMCVHRDLKPDNIMIDRWGYPVLVDFGVANFVPQDTTTQKLYSYCGTHEYMAPEVFNDLESGHDCSADHWSLGAVIYELVSGTTLFDSSQKGWRTRAKSVHRGNLNIPPKASAQVVDLIRKLLVRKPTLRLGSLERGELDILEHSWFDGLNLAAMRERKAPKVPWVPVIHGPLDTSHFPNC